MGRKRFYLIFFLLSACGLSSDDPNAGIENPVGLIITHESPTPAWNDDIHMVLEDSETYTELAAESGTERFYGQGPDNRIYYSAYVETDPGVYNLDLFSVAVDGTDRRSLASSANEKWFLGWSPSGRVIYSDYVRTDPLPSAIGDWNYNIYSVMPDGTGRVPLATDDKGEELLAITDTDKVIFRRYVNNQIDLHVVNADGTSPVTLANSAEFEMFHSYTPDGRVVYFINPGGSIVDLYSVNIDGTDTRQLTSNRIIYSVLFVTDDGWVIYREKVVDDFVLKSIRTDGSAFATLSDRTGDSRFNSFVDGRVIYTHIASDQGDIYSILPDGTDEKIVANSPLHEEWWANTPSGRMVINIWVPDLVDPFVSYKDIYTVFPDGTGLIQVTDGSLNELYKDTTSDGNIIFSEEDNSPVSRRLYSVPEDGSTSAKPLSSETGVAVYCGTANDGRVIYSYNPTASLADDQWDIYSNNQDGTNNITLTPYSSGHRCHSLTVNSRLVFQDFKVFPVKYFTVSSTGENLVSIDKFATQIFVSPKHVTP